MNFNFQKLLEDTGYETRSYSGRGMYGKECLAITTERGESQWDFFSQILDEVADTFMDNELSSVLAALSRILKDTCEDSMGLGSVFYWPRMKFEE